MPTPETTYSDMTLEDFLLKFCDEQVRAPRRARRRRAARAVGFFPSLRRLTSAAPAVRAQVAKIEEEAQQNVAKLRCGARLPLSRRPAPGRAARQPAARAAALHAQPAAAPERR